MDQSDATCPTRRARRLPAGCPRWRAVLAVAGLLTAALAAVSGAPAAAAAPASCSDTATAFATGLAPLPCLAGVDGRTRWSDNGQLLLPRSPSNLIVGDRRLARLFTLVCLNTGPLACPATTTGPTPPATTPAVTAVEQIFIQSRPGYATQYGELARVRVDQLTSVGRVQATLVLAQGAVDGTVRPVVARQSSSLQTYPAGTTVTGFEQFGPNPGPDRATVQGAVTGNGPAVATLTGVTVDGTSHDLSGCRATGVLRVSARGGWTNDPPIPGGPAEYRALTAPSYLHAKLSQVAADGCDDVDPVLAGLLLQNARFLQQVTIDFTVASALRAFGCLVTTTAGCTDRHPATVAPARVPAVV